MLDSLSNASLMKALAVRGSLQATLSHKPIQLKRRNILSHSRYCIHYQSSHAPCIKKSVDSDPNRQRDFCQSQQKYSQGLLFSHWSEFEIGVWSGCCHLPSKSLKSQLQTRSFLSDPASMSLRGCAKLAFNVKPKLWALFPQQVCTFNEASNRDALRECIRHLLCQNRLSIQLDLERHKLQVGTIQRNVEQNPTMPYHGSFQTDLWTQILRCLKMAHFRLTYCSKISCIWPYQYIKYVGQTWHFVPTFSVWIYFYSEVIAKTLTNWTVCLVSLIARLALWSLCTLLRLKIDCKLEL